LISFKFMGEKAISQDPASEEILAEHEFESKEKALEKIYT